MNVERRLVLTLGCAACDPAALAAGINRRIAGETGKNWTESLGLRTE